MEKEVKIVPPEGYEIDKDNSTLECIKFKPIQKPKFSDYDGSYPMEGYYMLPSTEPPLVQKNIFCTNTKDKRHLFATSKQAKSALAMAQISQIMKYDERFGGVITDEEWKNDKIDKYCINRLIDRFHSYIRICVYQTCYNFLAFHTEEQLKLFLNENEMLVKNYLMIDNSYILF